MAEFRIRMKLTGLEIEIEGSREEIPQISRNLGQQLTGLLQPAAGIVEGEAVEGDSRATREPMSDPVRIGPSTGSAGGQSTRKRTPRKRRSGGGGTPAAGGPATGTGDSVIEFAHDSAVFGSPRQEWNTAQKSLWLLYVVGEQTNRRELTAQQIAATFSRVFREAGQIIVQNVARDLGKLRSTKGKDSPVAEDTTMDPSPWYLTEAGRREGQALVAQARTGNGSDSGDGRQSAPGETPPSEG